MKVHKDVWRLLEMDKVLSNFASNVRSNLGLQTLAHLAPSENLENLYQRQELLRAYRDYVDRNGDFPWTQNVDSVEDLLLSARKTGLLLGRELLSVRTLLLLAEKIKTALSSIKEEVPPFGVLLRKIRDFSQEMKALSVLDEDGNLFDSASPDLSRIRKSEDSVRQTIRARAQSIFSNPRFNSMLQEKILSYRQNRFTVLVRQEFASRFPGTIVDRSGSGNSVYMEPRSMADLNSRLVLLLRDEEEEKRRILSEITAQVLSRERAILDAEKVLGQIDLLYAVTTVMDKKKWKLPLLAEKPLFAFHSLLHPLLGEHGVPLSIECGRDFRILVVTGPNTGGKTVTLKAVGVGTILAWCGLPIPAEEGSFVGNLNAVYADIGDEQSIEQNLSTFSSHLKNIIHIIEEADSHSLVLLDELGAGTDPQEGAALGVALLDTMREKKCVTLATTHHNPIKRYALTTQYVETASMEFDAETLAPTYRLLMGIPGRSNALYIAERYGMPVDVLAKARLALKEQEVSVEDIITDLQERKAHLDTEQKQIEKARQELAVRREKFQEKEACFERQKEQILSQAEQKATSILVAAEEESRRMLRALDESAKSAVQRALHPKREKIREKRKELEKREEKRALLKMKSEGFHPEVGDTVKISGTDITGTIVTLKGKKAEVLAGAIRMEVPISTLTRVSKPAREAMLPPSPKIVRPEGVPNSLMVRGMTVDEAMPLVEKYLDQAMRAGYGSVEIIHGRGEGILRREVHTLCAHLSYVENYRLGGPGEGGYGVTIITFKK